MYAIVFLQGMVFYGPIATLYRQVNGISVFQITFIESISYINSPHSAHDSAKKGAYALAITNCLFEPHQGGSVFDMHRAQDLIQEANEQGIKFSLNNFIDTLPPDMRANLDKPLDD